MVVVIVVPVLSLWVVVVVVVVGVGVGGAAAVAAVVVVVVAGVVVRSKKHSRKQCHFTCDRHFHGLCLMFAYLLRCFISGTSLAL